MTDQSGQVEGIAKAITAITDQANALIREEIELAKTEVKVKVESIARYSVIAIIAGVFIVIGFFYVLDAIAWAAWKLIFGGDDYWGGYLFVALLLFIVGGIAGAIAWQWLKKSSSPAPTMALDEARLIRETVTQAGEGHPVPPPVGADSAADSKAGGSGGKPR